MSDVVMLDCEDGYAGLLNKVGGISRWALQHGHEPAFKCDDDTFVRPDKLLASGFEQHDYSGFVPDARMWAHGGAGFWLSRTSMQIVAENSSGETTTRQPDDFTVAKILGRHGITPFHDNRYFQENRPIFRERVLEADTWITMHKCDPVEMRRIHLQPGNTASQTL